jgi:hypothetical protein
MVPTAVKKLLPHAVKHPLLTYEGWRWEKQGFPAQSPRDIAVFKSVLSSIGEEPLRVFEWGSGASTIFYPRFLQSIGREFDWHAVDNSKIWYEKTRERISLAEMDGRVHVYCSDFPAFWELSGYSVETPIPPASMIDDPDVARYVNYPRELGLRFHLVVVDGRFRRRCLLAAKDVLAPGGLLILHDAQRVHYHSSLAAYSQVHFLETGPLPGSKQRCSIALCALDDGEDGSIISQLVEEFRDR